MQPVIDHRHVVRLLGIGRIVIGGALVALPGRVGRGWLGATAGDRATKVALRGLGARDIAIGVATLRALDADDPSLRRWVTMAGLCDLTDAAASLVAFRALPPRGRLVSIAIAGGAAAAAFVARDRLD